MITVAESLEGTKDLQSIGGIPYLSALSTNTPSAANIRRMEAGDAPLYTVDFERGY